MSTRYALADLAALMAEPTRAAMLLSLMGGEALPAGELARAAGLSAAATSTPSGERRLRALGIAPAPASA